MSVELRNGEVYRGRLESAEDTMSCMLVSVTVTAKDGQVRKMEQVYLRGSQIKLFVLPDMLRMSPVFKKVASAKRSYDSKSAAAAAAAGRGRGARR